MVDPTPDKRIAIRPSPKGKRTREGYRRLCEVGAAAFRAGQKMADCPYKNPKHPDRWAWLAGWCDAEDAAKAHPHETPRLPHE